MSKTNIYNIENESNKFSQIFLEDLEKLLASRHLSVANYTSEEIISRINQIIVEENISLIKDNGLKKISFFNGKSLKIDLKNNKINVSRFIFLKNMLIFIFYLNYINWTFFKSLFSQIKTNKKIVIFDNNDIQNIVLKQWKDEKHFFNSGPVNLFKNKLIILPSTTSEAHYENFYYTRHPWLFSLNFSNSNLLDLIKFKMVVNVYCLKSLYKFIRNPILVLMAKDLSFHPLVSYLVKKNIILDYCISNSKIISHRLPFTRLVNSHMLWYSVNSKTFVFKQTDKTNIYELPAFRNISTKCHWVWNEDQKNWLKKNVKLKHDSFVVGPIMFYLPHEAPRKNNDKKIITIFDVTPISIEHLKEQQGLHGYNYYNLENCTRFINDIVETIDLIKDFKIELRLKPKRKYLDKHDANYLAYLESLKYNNKLIVLDFDTDIFHAITESDLTLNIPYSSPSLISIFHNVPAILYDPTEELVNTYEDISGLSFVSGKAELKTKLTIFFAK